MLQGDFCFVLFYFAKLEIKGNPWLKSAVPDSAMPHHLWCCVTDQSFDFLGLLPDLDLQSHCSNQCRFRTREWRALLQHKTGERKGRLGKVHSLMAFFSAASEKREKNQRKLRKPGKTRRKGPQGTKNSQRTSVQPGSLSWSTAPACCSAQQQSDALAGISGDITTAGSLFHSPACAGSGNRAQAARLTDLGSQLNSRSFPFMHLDHCEMLISCASKWGSVAWCRREAAAFVSYVCEEISHFWAKTPPLL